MHARRQGEATYRCLTPAPSPHPSPTLPRLAQVQRKREERADELRRRVQAEENATFTPHINPNSHALAEQQQL